MTEGGIGMKLIDFFEYYYYLFEKIVFINLSDLSQFMYIKYNYFINIFVNVFDIYYAALILNKNSFFNFKCALDFSVVDFYFKKNNRFKLFYIFLNLRVNKKLCLFANPKNTIYCSSICNIYNSMGWSEREVWDMFGFFFLNNCNLRRILSDYGFKGYPLRKDFPLTGFLELNFNNSLGEIQYRPVQLAQELRFFNFSSCWFDDSSLAST
jgi:NADH-quinone oxidoreductase subunit C